jgi:sterol 3beta-glucosyltransferase
MKILFTTGCGSTGDFRPSLCFTQALQRAGHSVVVLTTHNYKSAVESAGLQYAELKGDPREIMASPEVQQALSVGDVMKVFQVLGPIGKRIFEEGKIDYLKAVEDYGPFDVIVTIPTGLKHVVTVAEKCQIPVVFLSLVPTTATKQFGHVAMGNGNMGSEESNLSSYETLMKLTSADEEYTKWREQLGLKPIQHRLGYLGLWKSLNIPTIAPFSAVSIGGRPSDWPDNVHITGYMHLKSSDDKLEDRVEQFLNSGDKPIYLGFGSMPSPKPHLLINLAKELAQRTNNRVIYSAGWTNTTEEENSDTVLAIKEAPQLLLFPRCKCVLHHCGVGTTGAVLTSGVPHIPVPFFLDQPFWAQKMYELGVASKPIHFKDLTIDNLIESLQQVTQPDVIQRAHIISQQQLLEENGVENAVKVFERLTPVFVENLLGN